MLTHLSDTITQKSTSRTKIINDKVTALENRKLATCVFGLISETESANLIQKGKVWCKKY